MHRFPFVALLVVLSFQGCESKPALVDKEPALQLCKQWMLLKNEDDPKSAKHLEAKGEVPEKPLTQEEADRFEANWFLHEKIRIESISPRGDGRFVIVIEGSVSGPNLQVRSENRVDRVQRTMFHPDVIVEVRDGKIRGIRAEIHSDRR